MNKIKNMVRVFVIIFIMTIPLTVYAHQGRTDSSGGHHDYKNKSGLGSYHYHHGYPAHLHPSGVCPYTGYSGDIDISSNVNQTPSISVTNKPVTLYVGDNTELDITSSNTTISTLEITSNNEAVINVIEDHTLHAVGEGTAIITLTTNNASFSFEVTVKPIEVSSIEISNMVDKLQLDNSTQFTAIVKPDNATYKTVFWSSNNENIASVDENGKVEACGVGDVIITCTAKNGVKTDIPLEIYEVFPEEIKVSADDIKIECTKSKTISIDIMPVNANDKTYSIDLNNKNIVSIDKNNKITALHDGKTKLIIKTVNDIEKVIPIEVYHIPTTSINIDDKNISYIFSLFDFKVIGDKTLLNFQVDILPSDATFKSYNWLSSNTDIINVNESDLDIVGTGYVELSAQAYDKQIDKISVYIVNQDAVNLLIVICVLYICISVIILFINKFLKMRW